MLVGLVNSGIMELAQTVGVIMGSNIGTTLTAWILSLSGIESDNLFISMLKPENFSPVIALIGVIMIMGSKKEKRKDVGIIMAGFAVLMYGMQLMSGAVSPLADMPEFTGLLTTFNNPFLGVLVGAVFTGVIQSSAASVGVLQALAMTGAISYSMAIPIIMGQNIGTCVTALLSSIGVNKNAKRVSIIHISFNLFGTAIGLVVYCIARYAVDLTLFNDSITPVMIAVFHSIFNIATTIILLPFSNTLVKIAKKLVTTDNADGQVVLDERLLLSPGLAVKECLEKTNEMAELARDSFKNARMGTGGIVVLERDHESSSGLPGDVCRAIIPQRRRWCRKAVSEMAIDKVKAYFAEFGREGDVMEFPTSSATVELAAQAVGCEPARIAKTLSFAVGDRVALVVCAGDARIANPKFKAQFGCKPRMLPAEEAEERIGHAVGGVCPFAVNEGCDVYLDESLRRFDVVYPACGSSNSAIALTLDELAAYTPGSIWVDVCKLPE